jgi:hypothetical protein
MVGPQPSKVKKRNISLYLEMPHEYQPILPDGVERVDASRP